MPDRTITSWRKPHKRRAGFLPVFIALFLVLGWTVFWFLAAQTADREIHAWLAREDDNGRRWSCSSLKQGGYPVAITFHCAHPRIQTRMNGAALTVRLDEAVVNAPFYPLKPITLALTGPAVVAWEDRAPLRIGWRNMQISLQGPPNRLDRLSLVGDHIALQAGERPTEAQNETLADIETLEGQVTPTSGIVGAPYVLGFNLTGVNAPLLDTLSGTRDFAGMAGVILMNHLDKTAHGAMAERLEQWRLAGGRIHVQSAVLFKGAMSLSTDGVLGLDQGHAIEGKLDFRLRGARQTVLNTAVRLGLFRENSLPATLLGALLSDGREAQIALTAAGGALSIGPVKGAIKLPPLY